MEQKGNYKTPVEFLTLLANSTTNNEDDEKIMHYILTDIMKFADIKVVAGLVYGLIPQPADIHSVAKMMLKALEKQKILGDKSG